MHYCDIIEYWSYGALSIGVSPREHFVLEAIVFIQSCIAYVRWTTTFGLDVDPGHGLGNQSSGVSNLIVLRRLVPRQT